MSLYDAARAAAILGARWESDPLRIWRPYPKQKMFLENTKSEVALLGSNRCLPLTEPVLMADGTRQPLGRVQLHERVMAYDMSTGEARGVEVVGISRSGVKPVYRTTFSDGGCIRCTEEHQIPGLIHSGKTWWHHGEKVANVPRRRTLAAYRDRAAQSVSLRSRFLSPSLCIFDERHEAMELHPYLVGALLGDGGWGRRRATTFTNFDPEIVERVRSLLPRGVVLREEKLGHYRLNGFQFFAELLRAKCDEKRVPLQWLCASIEDREQVLAGLIDTDGSVDEFASKSVGLAEDVCFLVRSLGGKATLSLEAKMCVNSPVRAIGEYARVYWRLNRRLPLSLTRKQPSASKREPNYAHRIVRSIEPDGVEETGCLTIDHPDHCFIAGDWVVVGNSGKSDPLAACVSSLARFGNLNPATSYAAGGCIEIIDRAVSIWVIGLTEKLIKEGIQPKIVTTAHTAAETHPAFIPPSEIDSWNINDQTWRLKNGSMVGFRSADAGRDVFQSAARDLVAFDEICEWEVYKEATFRVPGGGRRLMIRLAATLLPPLGQPGGVSWFFQNKVKPWWNGGNKENRPCGENPHPNLDIYAIGMRDNPHIHPDEIRRLEDMFPDPNDPERRIRINGDLLGSIGGTLAYTGFNHQIHVDNNIVPENLDSRFPLCLCVDFNVSPCIWVVGQYIDRIWYFFDEIKLDQCKIPDMVAEFRRRYPTHSNELRIYGDQTGASRSVQTGESHYALISESFKGYPVPIRQCLPTRNPFVPDRLNAVNRAFVGADGRVGIIFGPRCNEAIVDCEEVLRDPRGGIKKTHHMESPYFQRTHAMDAVGYAVCFTDPVPQFVESSNSRLRHMPRPGYLGQGGRTASPAAPPMEMLQGGLRRTAGRGVMAPMNPSVRWYPQGKR